MELRPPQLDGWFTNGQGATDWRWTYSDWLLQAQTNAAHAGLTTNWTTFPV